MTSELLNEKIELDICGEGKPLVFIHGALVDKTMWRYQVDYFKSRYKVITFDMPGHGKSREIAVDPYTVEEIANHIIEALDSYNIEKFYLCGHSLGGIVSQEIAINHSERLYGLILAETSFGTKSNFIESVETTLANAYMKLISQKQLISMSAKFYGKCSKETQKYVTGAMQIYSIEESRKVMKSATGYSSLGLLHLIKTDTLVLVGQHNKQTHKQGKKLSALIPKASYVIIPGAHHILCYDNPKRFNAEMIQFLDKVEGL